MIWHNYDRDIIGLSHIYDMENNPAMFETTNQGIVSDLRITTVGPNRNKIIARAQCCRDAT